MISKDYLEMEIELERMLQRQEKDIIGEKALDQISIEECGDPLIKLTDYVVGAIISMKGMRRRFDNETLYVRKSVAERLKEVARDIYPLNLKFFDAFRPIEIQQQAFDLVFSRIKEDNPSWTVDEIKKKAFHYVFPPSWDLKKPPPHSTGGAIDLTIIDGRSDLDMGSNYADFNSPFICTNAEGLSALQRDNRCLLVRSMARRGFVNYPGEWWHFSFGDREWVAYLGLSLPAIYGRMEDPLRRDVS